MTHAPSASLTQIGTLWLLLAHLSGCAPEAASQGTCPTGAAVGASSAQGRRLFGAASRYPADGELSSRADALRQSQRARRAAAWEVVARVLAPVPVREATAVAEATVPRFRTWYDREDLNRVFQRLYATHGREGRSARAPFAEAALDEAFGWNARYLDTLDLWPASRWSEYVASVHDAPTLAGVSGLRRIAVSPDAARHIVSSYAEVLQCLEHGAPAAFVDGPPDGSQRLARESLSLPRCGSQTFGPYFVARGASLTARLEGAVAARATLRVLDATGAVRCESRSARECSLDGPGVFRTSVASTEGSVGVLEVRHTPPHPTVAGCLRGVFPLDAASVAMQWRRSDIGRALPVYDTSAAGLARRLSTASPTWGSGDGEATPSDDSIYTAFVDGGVFQLAGMHIRTRELDRWTHITLWWSPQPNTDFGADRPASVRALGGPWDSYKMCVVTDFDEGDPDPSGGFARDAPTLASALRAVYEGRGAPGWCSNPYIDDAPGLVRSNCIGCHQHAMSGVRPGMTVGDNVRFPSAGRSQTRDNFPSDLFWGLDASDSFSTVFAETVSWWSAADAR